MEGTHATAQVLQSTLDFAAVDVYVDVAFRALWG